MFTAVQRVLKERLDLSRPKLAGRQTDVVDNQQRDLLSHGTLIVVG
jgi:hypothetical protein